MNVGLGVVLFPGMMIPLKAVFPGEMGSIQKALTAGCPLKGMIVMEPSEHDEEASNVGCLAVIRQVGRQGDGTPEYLIAQGRQRVKVLSVTLGFEPGRWIMTRMARVEILPQECVPRMPKEIQDGLTHWGAWAARQMDPYSLANVAYDHVSKVLSEIRDLRHDPRLFSYWLAASLPVSCSERQRLLSEESVSYRLRHEIELLRSVMGIFCNACHERLGQQTDLIVMSESGPSDVFVNAGGYVHDLITLRTVRRIQLQGEPVKEHSWFPGYAWTIAYCSNCIAHVGWKFTAVDNALEPKHFWGLSRVSITHGLP